MQLEGRGVIDDGSQFRTAIVKGTQIPHRGRMRSTAMCNIQSPLQATSHSKDAFPNLPKRFQAPCILVYGLIDG